MSGLVHRKIPEESSQKKPPSEAYRSGEAVHHGKKRKSVASTRIKKAIIIFASIALFFIGVLIIPSDYKCLKYSLPRRPSLKGPLAANNLLTKAEYILKGQIKGPESILVEGEILYTGTADGAILKIENGKIKQEIRLHDGPCGDYDLEPICGRPLGIRRLNANELVVADAYLGIFILNFDKGTHKQILKGGTEVDGIPLKFLNDLDVINEDLLIVTDSSSRWDRRRFMKIILEAIPNGRVLSLVPSTGQVRTIVDKLHFANGIQLFPDKQSFLVSETNMARIKRHWIAGPKKDTTEIFVENLPGMPDNIRLGLNNTFWIALASVRRRKHFSLIDFFQDNVHLREILLKLVPDKYWKNFLYLRPDHTMIVEVDMNGHIVSSAHDLEGKMIKEVSQVTQTEKYLYLGSFQADFIARMAK